MTTWLMRILRWIPKATDRHSEYGILIAFPLPQWLQKRASLLRYAYIGCLAIFITVLLNPFQSNFSANLILPSSYLFWAVKRLVDYL
jgi:hypothetical protein